MSPLKVEFGTRDRFEEIVEFFGEPPCKIGLVQVRCTEELPGEPYRRFLQDVCHPMKTWLKASNRDLSEEDTIKGQVLRGLD